MFRLHKKVKVWAPATAVAAAVMLLLGQAPAQAAPLSGWYAIQNKNTKLCVDAPAFSQPSPRAQISQHKCDVSVYDNQRWNFRPKGTVTVNGKVYNNYLIANAKGGLCLDVPYTGAQGNGALVSVYQCASNAAADNQEWYVATRSSGGREGVWIINKKSRKCLDVEGYDNKAEARLTLFTCSDSAGEDHYWRISKTV